MSLKLPKKHAKDQNLAATKELEEHFGFKLSGSELVAAWKSIRACMLREVQKVTEGLSKPAGQQNNSQWKFFTQLQFLSLGSSVASNVALKIVSCNITLRQWRALSTAKTTPQIKNFKISVLHVRHALNNNSVLFS